jgi:23S rRNA pseudouridine1911/1915/1917 synthase
MTSSSLSFPVTPELAGQTLAAVLRRHVSGASWSQIRRQVERSAVRVNRVVCRDAARRLRAGDIVELGPPGTQADRLAEQVRLLYADRHLAVVDKPSGLATERRREERSWPARRKALQPTLDELLSMRLMKGRSRSKRPADGVILVHRLDRDTSGLLVVARTVEAAQGLIRQFRAHSAERVYRAVVVGRPGTVTIRSHLVRNRGDGLRGSTHSPAEGRVAVTHLRELEPIGPFCLVECRLETGRTNQIRIHLAERGCPVCGEVKYNRRPDGTTIEDSSRAPRLALHAAELRFAHPITQAPMHFTAPWPADLEQFASRLRRAFHAEQRP